MIITRDTQWYRKKELDFAGKDENGMAPLPSLTGYSANSSLGSLVPVLELHSADQCRHTDLSAISFPTHMTSWKAILFPKANSVFYTQGLHLYLRLSPTLWFIYVFIIYACACVCGAQGSMSGVPLLLFILFLRQVLSLNKGLGICLDWLSTKSSGSACPHSAGAGVTVVCHCLAADLVLSFRTPVLMLVQPTELSP